jgi:hypothetical protein
MNMQPGKKFFLNVNRGLFSERQTEGQPQTTFTEITGHLVNITFKETAFGPAMRLHVVDENNFYMLSMFVSSRPASAFFMLAKNLELQHEMTFKMKSIEGKDFFSINQFGGPVLWFYTIENVSILPQDTDERKQYLLDTITGEILPALQKRVNPFPAHTLYKPMRKGIQGGYFPDEKTSVGNRSGSAFEGTPGFGKSTAKSWKPD